jgi:hypothetical protein
MAQQIAASQLKAGMTYVPHFDGGASARVINKVFTERDTRGREWLKWTWTPAQRLDGGMDCGFGGIWAEFADGHLVTVSA